LVDGTAQGTTNTLISGAPVRFHHFDEEVELDRDGLSFGPPDPVDPPPEPVTQPPGREPRKRRPAR
jgi:hypothetical protein